MRLGLDSGRRICCLIKVWSVESLVHFNVSVVGGLVGPKDLGQLLSWNTFFIVADILWFIII